MSYEFPRRTPHSIGLAALVNSKLKTKNSKLIPAWELQGHEDVTMMVNLRQLNYHEVQLEMWVGLGERWRAG